ncbi:MAG: ribbon-helix-helix protein, CopG family [Desulfobacteraceae bacterium]|nr:ribbon-helix-helix protein, CopG family [Desulfobacteraceae bacterium]
MKKNRSILIRVVTPELLKELDELASSRGISRSAVIRNLITNCKICYQFLETEWKTQKPQMVEMEKGMAKEVLEELPSHYTSDMALVMSKIMRKVAEAMERGERKTP